MSLASGRAPAITTTETHGASSGTGATDLAGRHGHRAARGDPDRPDDRPGRARLARPRRWPARRPEADRTGRLLDAAVLLDRVGARRRPARADGGAGTRRRGVALPDRGARQRRSAGAARP